MKVLVYGGRKYMDQMRVFAELDVLHDEIGITEIIEGGAPGADRFAANWAKARGVKLKEFKADWDDLQAPVVRAKRRRDGSFYNAAAGNNRNLVMMVQGKPDVAMEFPGESGTASMRRIVKSEMKRRALRYIPIKE